MYTSKHRTANKGLRKAKLNEMRLTSSLSTCTRFHAKDEKLKEKKQRSIGKRRDRRWEQELARRKKRDEEEMKLVARKRRNKEAFEEYRRRITEKGRVLIDQEGEKKRYRFFL